MAGRRASGRPVAPGHLRPGWMAPRNPSRRRGALARDIAEAVSPAPTVSRLDLQRSTCSMVPSLPTNTVAAKRDNSCTDRFGHCSVESSFLPPRGNPQACLTAGRILFSLAITIYRPAAPRRSTASSIVLMLRGHSKTLFRALQFFQCDLSMPASNFHLQPANVSPADMPRRPVPASRWRYFAIGRRAMTAIMFSPIAPHKDRAVNRWGHQAADNVIVSALLPSSRQRASVAKRAVIRPTSTCSYFTDCTARCLPHALIGSLCRLCRGQNPVCDDGFRRFGQPGELVAIRSIVD